MVRKSRKFVLGSNVHVQATWGNRAALTRRSIRPVRRTGGQPAPGRPAPRSRGAGPQKEVLPPMGYGWCHGEETLSWRKDSGEPCTLESRPPLPGVAATAVAILTGPATLGCGPRGFANLRADWLAARHSLSSGRSAAPLVVGDWD